MLLARKNVTVEGFTAFAAGFSFAGLVVARGIPTLRHDWNWPIDRTGVASFVESSASGWVSSGFGFPNAHPTSYLAVLPLGVTIWIVGPIVALALFTFITGYACARNATKLCGRWNAPDPAIVGIGLFAVFNPWVYNEVVAGHLTMVLAYAGFIGLVCELLSGVEASSVWLAIWFAIVSLQLQFVLIAALLLVAFGLASKKWLPLASGLIFTFPTIVGVIAERGTLAATPYTSTWQINQSVWPLRLLGLGGYFTGYSDRLALGGAVATWMFFALTVIGIVSVARRTPAILWVPIGAAILFILICGAHGPLATPYLWLVRNVPESGVFRELYDLAGPMTALLMVTACAAMATRKELAYAGACAGVIALGAWLFQPPNAVWIPAASYPHPALNAPPNSRVALLPAFQPLALIRVGGSGADPDAYVRSDGVDPLNEYFATYPVDMALARYVQRGDMSALRGLGVAEIVPRPWLVSLSNGSIGLAARVVAAAAPMHRFGATPTYVGDPAPLVSACALPHVIALPDQPGACNLFFGDVASQNGVHPLRPGSDSLDPRDGWIDARLTFAELPAFAQALGGTFTTSRLPYRIAAGSTVLTNIDGRLLDQNGKTLLAAREEFQWLKLPADTTSVACDGFCELVATAQRVPRVTPYLTAPRSRPLTFWRLAPWLYVAWSGTPPAQVVRLNERYDAGWIAIASWRILRHVRLDMSANGWFDSISTPSMFFIVESTAVVQAIAELIAIAYLVWLLKAAKRGRINY